jgi:hypothetical protein
VLSFVSSFSAMVSTEPILLHSARQCNATPNQATEPTPPDLIMSLFAILPSTCSPSRPRQRSSSCSR